MNIAWRIQTATNVTYKNICKYTGIDVRIRVYYIVKFKLFFVN